MSGPKIRAGARPRADATGRSLGHVARGRLTALGIGTVAVGIYGGYFTAAQGILLIGVMGALLPEDMQRRNAALAWLVQHWPRGFGPIQIFVFWLRDAGLAVGLIAGLCRLKSRMRLTGRWYQMLPRLLARLILKKKSLEHCKYCRPGHVGCVGPCLLMARACWRRMTVRGMFLCGYTPSGARHVLKTFI